MQDKDIVNFLISFFDIKSNPYVINDLLDDIENLQNKENLISFVKQKIGYEKYGSGHALDDDIELMNILKIPVFDPVDVEDLKTILSELEHFNAGVFYIRLGKDE